MAAVLATASLLGVLGAPAYARRERIRRSGIAVVDAMEGIEFEERVASLYRFLGYSVRTTAITGDFGADLVAERAGERVVVQAKRYRGTVGIEAVQQAVAAVAHYGAQRAVVVTNSVFTHAATVLAGSNDVELVNRQKLVEMLADQQRDEPAPHGLGVLVLQIASGIPVALRLAASVLRLVVKAIFGAVRIALPWR